MKSRTLLGFDGFTTNTKSIEDFLDENLNYSAREETMTKKSHIDAIDEIIDYDYIDYVIRELSNDVFYKHVDTNDTFIKASVPEGFEVLGTKCDKLIKDSCIYEILIDNISNLLSYGELILRIKDDFSVSDEIDQSNYMPVYKHGKIRKVLDIKNKKLLPKDKFLVFTLFKSSKKSTVKTEKNIYYTRVPKGIIPYTVINKLNSLKLLEELQPLIELQSIDEKMFFYLRFPSETDVADAHKKVSSYERFLKNILQLQEVKDTSTLADRMSRVRVIPLFGDQSEIQQNNISKINRIDQSQVDNIKETISKLININIHKDNDNNVPYLKMITSIRSMIRTSLEYWIKEYVRSLGGKSSEQLKSNGDKIKIIIPDIKGLDEISALDYISLYSNSVNEVNDLIKNISEAIEILSNKPGIDKEILIEYYNNKIEKVIGKRIFEYTSQEEESSESDE